MDSTQVTYEGIRQNIIEYMSANPTFKDYNFTAPAISTLVDALAYTSHFLIRYANFSLNECFLDSAQVRANVVSHAKSLGYIPYQYTAAKVKLRLRMVNPPEDMSSSVSIPIGTEFLATTPDGEKTYTFRTVRQYFFQQNDDKVWYADIETVEGTFVTERFIQDEYYTTRYILINEKIDVSYMNVIVYASQTDTVGVEFSPVRDINSFSANSNIYFLEENSSGKVEVYFGDGKMATKINPYSVISVRYLVTNGSEANNIVNFRLAGRIGTMDTSVFALDVISPSEQGADKEGIESIRFNAPKYFQAQDRAVTTTDYNALLINKFGGWIDSVITWGGEDNIPPQYASVFVCCKPRYTEVLSPSQKEQIMTFLNGKNLPCIDVQIVDPSYIDVIMKVKVDWYKYKTSMSKNDVYNKIKDTIEDFFRVNVCTFSSKFKYSKFLSDISDIDVSIDSILTDVTLRQYLIPISNLETSYRIEFMNKIDPGTVYIGSWYMSGDNSIYWMADEDKDGKLYLCSSYGQKTLIGTVNYEDGTISVNNYEYKSNINLAKIPVTCVPVLPNINTAKNYILSLSDLTIDIQEA